MSEFDFRDYLSAIVTHYSNQRHLYTLTDVLLPLEARWSPTDQRSTVEREEERQEKQRVEQFSVLAGLRRYALGDEREHVLLAGRPGSGKSTALRQLVVELAILGEHEGGGSQIPVLVQLKGDRTVPELIKAEFRARKVRVTDEQIEDWLVADRLILLLDGVNEIPTEELRRSLAQFREDNSTVPMIFTTRDLSLGGDLGIGKRLEMKPLSEGQLREFVGKYLPEQGEKLLGQLRDRLREIAETPLLLKMLCDVFGRTGEIPANKGELFRLFDREYEKFKSLPAVSADFRRFKSEILQHLAFVMMQGDESKPTEFWLTIGRSQAERSIEQWLTGRVSDPGVRAKEWLEDLLEHHLLQVAADSRRVEFHHQLFQEYYAAEALLGMFADRRPDVVEPERFQHFYLNYLKWTECVAIGLSLMEDEKTAVDLVQQALDVDLMLGARLAGEVRLDFQSKTVDCILHQKLPDQQAIPKCLKVRLLGETKSELALVELLIYMEDSDSDVRHNLANAIAKIASYEAISVLIKLLEDPNSDVRSCSAYRLGILGHTESVLPLIGAAIREFDLDEDVFGTMINALGKLHQDITMSELVNLLDNPSLNARITAVNGLGAVGSENAIPFLDKLIEDSSLEVRRDAVSALGQIRSKKATFSIIRALQNPDLTIRCFAVTALGQIGFINDFSRLSGFVHSLDDCIQWSRDVLLGNITLNNDIPDSIRINQTTSDNWSEDSSAVGEDEQKIPVRILPILLQHLATNPEHTFLRIIQSIQANCKFYNDEIFHSPPAKPQPTQPSPPPGSTIVHGDYIAGDKIGRDKILGNKTEAPNATEVKIFEQVDNYHEFPPRDPPP